MESRVVQTFLCVCDLNSFTRAAEKLSYAQSTVTLHIQQLEAELGTPLFNRIGRKISLTEQGARFYQYATEFVKIENEAKLALSEDAPVTGTLRFGVTQSLLTDFIAPCLPEYRKLHPQVTLDISADMTQNLVRKLKQNEFDMIMIISHTIHDRDLECLFASPEPIALMASPKHPLAKKKKLSLEDVFQADLILPNKPSLFREAFDSLAASKSMELQSSLQINDTRVIADMVENGMGIGLLPEYTVRHRLEKGRVVALRIPELDLTYTSQVFRHKHKWQSPQMNAMLDLIKTHTTPFEEKHARLYGKKSTTPPQSSGA